jgi:hypothetical protein
MAEERSELYLGDAWLEFLTPLKLADGAIEIPVRVLAQEELALDYMGESQVGPEFNGAAAASARDHRRGRDAPAKGSDGMSAALKMKATAARPAATTKAVLHPAAIAAAAGAC